MHTQRRLFRARAATGTTASSRHTSSPFTRSYLQVELMAGTGILIAPHGAHLANTMFLPARAAVIELFPPVMKKGT